jgi:putative Mg2+ transporter-C (MgtC) family protein
MLDLDQQELVLRLIVALLLGSAVGFEREVTDRPAGMRTHALAAEGSALFTMAGLLIAEESLKAGYASTDPGRIASIVVQGIGFLAAGVIFAHGARVQGLTTAAGLWVTSAIGILAGAGFYFLAISAAIATVVVLTALKLLEQRMGTKRGGQSLGGNTDRQI